MISVILPVFNAEPWLEEALDSLFLQEFGDFEVIALDDGSEDNSLRILRQKARGEARLKVVALPHGGIVAALNRGLALAQGSLIARMDADDLCLPGRFQLQAEFLARHPEVGLVSCQVAYGCSQGQEGGFKRYVEWSNSLVSPQAIGLNRFVESPVVHPTVMFRRELIEKWGGYRDGVFPEDYELWLRWLDAGVVMAKLPRVLLSWRERPDRLSRVDPRYSVDAFYRTKSRYLKSWLAERGIKTVAVWGAGRTSRKRAEILTQHGIEIGFYIDIDPKKIGNRVNGRPVLSMDALPEPGHRFILSYVGSWGARELIERHLQKRGYRVGAHYLLVG